MKSAPHGTGTSGVEVADLSTSGFALLFAGRRFVVPFAEFPWFDGVAPAELRNVELLHGDHLYWPDLDIDLSLECIEHPARFPLVSRVRGAKRR
jgi:hypothetical protein